MQLKILLQIKEMAIHIGSHFFYLYNALHVLLASFITPLELIEVIAF
ncbi:hypothetical protein SAMN05444369_10857 [Capnocytophaga haemolytica]|uniref:Uncharacterized protein n=1 Tax=Capnocytophaga haemolytica TaxID=45243 RepID=A0AAX2H178_9FLAO|nr:hypothetical protein SAMN05444369_10857 [Capnocytophaga haemolytica]SNV13525.1 Uncharacterised protein [Capnocytophaga haemolytica]